MARRLRSLLPARLRLWLDAHIAEDPVWDEIEAELQAERAARDDATSFRPLLDCRVLEPELPGDTVTDVLLGEDVSDLAGFEVQRILFSLGPGGVARGRAVLLTLMFGPHADIGVLRVPIDAQTAARLGRALVKHAGIVERKLQAGRN